MKIGILCASDDELAPFLPCIQQSKTTKKAMLTFYEGRIGQIPVVAVFSGVCKVNAAIAAQILIEAHGVTAIVNGGTAGGMSKTVGLFDTVVSEQVAYHDVAQDILTDFHPWMPSVWFAADEKLLAAARRGARGRTDVFFGRMVTGEAFISKQGRRRIVETFDPLSVDMESGAVAHVCYVNHVPFLAVRTITDTAEYAGEEIFEQNCRQAAALSKDFVLRLLEELENSGQNP